MAKYNDLDMNLSNSNSIDAFKNDFSTVIAKCFARNVIEINQIDNIKSRKALLFC